MKTHLFAFLEELRGSDEARKRRWAAGLSAVSMTAVLMLWLFMFSANLDVTHPAGEPQEESRAGTFFGTFRAGSAILWQRLSSVVGREREVEIRREEFTFIPENAPAAPVHELPVR